MTVINAMFLAINREKGFFLGGINFVSLFHLNSHRVLGLFFRFLFEMDPLMLPFSLEGYIALNACYYVIFKYANITCQRLKEEAPSKWWKLLLECC